MKMQKVITFIKRNLHQKSFKNEFICHMTFHVKSLNESDVKCCETNYEQLFKIDFI